MPFLRSKEVRRLIDALEKVERVFNTDNIVEIAETVFRYKAEKALNFYINNPEAYLDIPEGVESIFCKRGKGSFFNRPVHDPEEYAHPNYPYTVAFHYLDETERTVFHPSFRDYHKLTYREVKKHLMQLMGMYVDIFCDARMEKEGIKWR